MYFIYSNCNWQMNHKCNNQNMVMSIHSLHYATISLYIVLHYHYNCYSGNLGNRDSAPNNLLKLLLWSWDGAEVRALASRCHMWVEFVVGSLLCSQRFFYRYSGFPFSSKTNTSKFQFDNGMHWHFLNKLL